MNHNLQQGLKGEELARQHIEQLGFKVKERNWRYRKKEIDLIGVDADDLVIIEVKTRASNQHGEPQDFVSKTKQAYLIAAANAYARKINWPGSIRFDIVAITIKPKLKLEYLREAFYAWNKKRGQKAPYKFSCVRFRTYLLGCSLGQQWPKFHIHQQ